jgi:hypothetical protein
LFTDRHRGAARVRAIPTIDPSPFEKRSSFKSLIVEARNQSMMTGRQDELKDKLNAYSPIAGDVIITESAKPVKFRLSVH